jgi:hypothetical protein
MPAVVARAPDAALRIALQREGPLHAAIKRWYARPGDRVEVPIERYVIDLVRDDQLIEVQTRGFAGMKPKVRALLAVGRRVRIVHPIAVDRWIVTIDDDGAVIARRRSPRHGRLIDLVAELVSFPELLDDPGLEIEVLLTAEEEVRRLAPGRCWRRRGWTTVERRLVDVLDRVLLRSGRDLAGLLPDDLPGRFTTAELAERSGRSRRTAQQAAYCLRRLRLIEADGTVGRATAYRVAT